MDAEPSDRDVRLAERMYLLLDIAYTAASNPEEESGWRRFEAAVATDIDDLEDAHAIICLLIARDAADMMEKGETPTVMWAWFYERFGHRLK